MEKRINIRVFPQGPFYVTFSNTKIISNGTIIMEFKKNNMEYKVYGEANNVKAATVLFLYEDINDFIITVKNSEIKFRKPDSEKSFSMFGNFSDLMFIGFSSYSPAQWTVQEGN